MNLPARYSNNSNNKRALRTILVREQNLELASQIEEKKDLSAVAARILAARKFTLDKELEDFLNPTLQNGLPDPAKLKNIDKASELLASVAATNKPIAICCDFDVDGMSGGSMLSRFLLDAGVLNKVFVPDRFKDGYGLNISMVQQIAEAEFGLIVTVDYGTSNALEIGFAKDLGIPTIVIDHHHVEKIPPADVFVNPQQEGCDFASGTLAAAGLAWYFLVALKKVLPGAKQLDVRSYLDLACLGTICDMVPLKGANRVIAKKGLERITSTQRAGLKALKDVVGINKAVACSHIGFGIGPRLNAAGRMLSGDLVIQLLTTADSRKAGRIARRLNKVNQERQSVEKKIKAEAITRISELEQLPDGIVVWDESFHTGVIGLVAQRLSEYFYRPSIVCGKDTEHFKGSVRGIKGFNVVEALSDLQAFLLKFGGHAGAGGFSIEEDNLHDFCNAFNIYCNEKLKTIPTTPTVTADAEIKLNELNARVISELETFAPFGVGNPAPVIAIDNLEVLEVQKLKGEHLKLQLTDGKIRIPALFWQVSDHPAVEQGVRVRIAGKPEVNSYGGNVQLQINLQAIESC